jgi:Ca-activated chloride channel family protein
VTFSDPGWLLAGLAACLGLLWMWRRYDRRQHQALAQLVSPHLRAPLTHSVSRGRRRLQRALMLGAVAMTFVALAGPLLGFRWEWISRRGIQIMFAMDTSRSMSTPDVRPDRLTRAKLAIDDFTHKLDGDAIGLIAFAGDAFVICPVTLDYGAFHESLNAIDVGTIPRGGTNISMAIEEAQAALLRRSGTDKILILITDGENLEGDALVAAKNAAKEEGLRIYTIGVGTAQGDLIPLGSQPSAGFLKDEAGNFVRSRLDEPALQAIAAATGGMYAPLGAEGQGFETIYQQSLAPMLKHDLASRRQRVYIQRYQWPLSAALVLLLASLLVGNRRRFGLRKHRPAPSAPRLPGLRASPADRPIAAGRARASAVAAVLLLAGIPAARTAHASSASAKQAYEHGDFTAAAAEYAAEAKRDPQKPTLTYNLGTAQYRAGDFAAAAQAFQSSINRAPSGDASRLAEQEDAYYDLGNTLYRAGQRTEQSNAKQTLDNWDQAVKAYETALAIRPSDADSKYNRDFVKRKIDELKKQQKNNPQNQNQGGGGQGGGQGQQNQPPQNQPPGQQPPPQGQPPQGQPPGQNQKQPPNQGQNQQPPQGGSQNQPPQNQPPQGQPPQGQPPQGQPPQNQSGQPNAQNQQPQNPPPNSQGKSQPPPSAGSQPPSPTPPGNGSPQPANGQGQNQGGGGRDADGRRIPGQMSPEEARQLLDSEKGDERNALGIPYARRGGETPPDKPVKDW